MPTKEKILRFLTREWVIGLFLLLVFLLTNGYTYGWDDQHLEIPLLKSLINPDLYPGDYYVQSLKTHFTSYLYPLLAKVIAIDQIPAVFLLLFLISRYVLFTFIYRLWHLVSGQKTAAVMATLMIILLGRVDEFLYRTFSHQEFALAMIFIGIYFFYRERFILAALILGLAANFHVLYSLFPVVYLMTYLAVYRRGRSLKLMAQTLAGFLIAALPIMIWALRKKLNPAADAAPVPPNWMDLYKIACPQNLVLYDNTPAEVFSSWPLFLERFQPYALLLVFWAVHRFHNAIFQGDKKTRAAVSAGFGLIAFSYVFNYVWPVRQILDLNLVRNSQYILFFLMGYTALLMTRVVRGDPMWVVVPFLTAFILIRFGGWIAVEAGILIFLLLTLRARIEQKGGRLLACPNEIALCAGMLACAVGIIYEFRIHKFSHSALLCLLITVVLIWVAGIWDFLLKSKRHRQFLRIMLLLLPFTALFINFIGYHRTRQHMERQGTGFWQLQRNWLDMQLYVKNNLPQNALLLVPYDMEMGGFRIFSERPIVVSYRDCGIIGFDYAAAIEWQSRIRDIENFKVLIAGSLTQALKNAIEKYGVNYIVFMRYADPGANTLLEPIYQNETFALYQVKLNPV